MIQSVKDNYAGVLVCILIAVATMALAAEYVMPVMMLAIIVGLALHSLWSSDNLKSGIEWSSNPLLLIAVALLGLRIDLSVLTGSGWVLPVFAVALLGLTLVIGYVIGRTICGDKFFAILLASAVAVCGISAAVAVCCALPKCEEREGQLALTIGGITVLSTLAMIAYPAFAGYLNLSDIHAGMFAGGTIHNVSQAVGAGYTVSGEAGDMATLIKLIRVSALLPVIVGISLLFNKSGTGQRLRWQTYFPPFLLAFFALAILKTLGWVPAIIDTLGRSFSEFFLVISLIAIGMKTNMKQLIEIGAKPLIAMSVTTLAMAGLALAGLSLLPSL